MLRRLEDRAAPERCRPSHCGLAMADALGGVASGALRPSDPVRCTPFILGTASPDSIPIITALFNKLLTDDTEVLEWRLRSGRRFVGRPQVGLVSRWTEDLVKVAHHLLVILSPTSYIVEIS
ncbi:hypothetical protein EVAR_6459_1 [Eumeta japonica]|uniref:Uncharacterized protein n=1 Tax=Eumeta variegata TaxID=151549 RepID=A0A4C1SSI5_EUMVA|nr:hypothetical protein EVAR_6459_1 [Eumeta japonica]